LNGWSLMSLISRVAATPGRRTRTV
jgi:hypothetical protein